MTGVPIVTPVGRLVQGSLSSGSQKGFKGEDLVWKTGQNAGQPRTVWYAGLAIPKDDPGVPELFAAMQQAAAAGYPGGQSALADFAWKLIDGDSVDSKGKPYAEREGHAGCHILRFTTSYPVKCSQDNGAGLQVEIPAEQIKLGHYIRIAGTITAGDVVNPSIFLNMNMVQLVGYGQEISTGPDANTVFAQPAALPAGASATPLAPATGGFEQAATPVTAGVSAGPGAPVAAAPVAPAAVPVAAAPVAAAPVAAAPVAPVAPTPIQPNPAFTQAPPA
jgi:hypothetical protein